LLLPTPANGERHDRQIAMAALKLSRYAFGGGEVSKGLKKGTAPLFA
jgi:hypothetical protein